MKETILEYFKEWKRQGYSTINFTNNLMQKAYFTAQHKGECVMALGKLRNAQDMVEIWDMVSLMEINGELK